MSESYKLGLGDAHTGRCTGSYSGGVHYMLLEGRLDRGRLHREKGDALCRPGQKFWGLYARTTSDGDSPVSCKKCKEIAARLGLTLPQPRVSRT